MTLKIKTPPMPEPDGPWHWTNIKNGKSGLYEEDPRQFGIDLEHPEYKWVRLPSAAQLAARDAQWLELLGPVVVAMRRLLNSDPEGGIANASEDELYEATNDPDADPVVREQAAAVLQSRAALRAITEEQK